MSALYNNIESLCKARGITSYRLSKDIGISQGIISDLKSGRKKGISAELAAKIASYFDVTIHDLLGPYVISGESKIDPESKKIESIGPVTLTPEIDIENLSHLDEGSDDEAIRAKKEPAPEGEPVAPEIARLKERIQDFSPEEAKKLSDYIDFLIYQNDNGEDGDADA